MSTDAIVYVVDDDESVRKALTRMFRTSGWRVSAFASGTEFLDADLPDTPCCLVLDVRMPGLSGLEVQERLHTRDVELPIVFMTAHGDEHTRERAMNGGAFEFLLKPIVDIELVDTVRRAILPQLGA
ncbi:response regulator transcription factor [Haloferula sp.]|uniref:response regulator transcription factor n=1 Tax=Haloferula sp. TaxID=2497595 RepID=UPI00329D4648